MLYKKDKVIVLVNHGKGKVYVGPLRGTIDSIIIHPQRSSNKGYVIYDFSVLDEEEDEIFFKADIVNKHIINKAIPVGKSQDERVICVIDNSNYNIDFEIILLTKER